MVCEHLRAVDEALRARGVKETFRGQAWTQNCREWVYYDCFLSADDLIRHFALSPCVEVHRNEDPRSGTELGLVCASCHDGIMGSLTPRPGQLTFDGRPH